MQPDCDCENYSDASNARRAKLAELGERVLSALASYDEVGTNPVRDCLDLVRGEAAHLGLLDEAKP